MVYVLILMVAAVALAPFVFEAQRRVVDQRMRDQSGGQFARLPVGVTHYRWDGPPDGPVIVAIHGLTTPMVVWSGITPHLTAAGYRVLQYDLLGRGLSDAPRGPQDVAFFARQLDALLRDQRVTGPVVLMGYSMGAMVAAAHAAAVAPTRVSALALIAPAGIVTAETWFDWICRRVPVIGDWLHAMFAAGRARRGPPKPDAIAAVQAFQLTRRGYLPAVLASRRGALAATQADVHQAIATSGPPVLAVWGGNDRVIPPQAMGRLAQWNRRVDHVQIDEADHAVPYTHAAEVAAAVLGFLRPH